MGRDAKHGGRKSHQTKGQEGELPMLPEVFRHPLDFSPRYRDIDLALLRRHLAVRCFKAMLNNPHFKISLTIAA